MKTKKRTSKKTVRRSAPRRSSDTWSLTSTSSRGFWGKDQPMVLVLSAGIVVCIVAGLYLTGWL